MNKMFLIKNPKVFQGEKYLNKNKEYFEGWYFKGTSKEKTIAFISGINITKEKKEAFVQIITAENSYFINYNIKDFNIKYNPFSVYIGNNIFSEEGIHIDIKDKIKIYGDIKYFKNKNIKTSFISPNIMGPFSYIPFMECNHAILSMRSNIYGHIKINGKDINLEDGIGYIEKDWGISFPKRYIWCQGNNFKNKEASFMISVADVPLKVFKFRGIICVLIIDNKEFKFTTYNNTKIIKYNVTKDSINITIKNGEYYLNVESKSDSSKILAAPVKGNMEKDILESITSYITVTLKKNSTIIFSDTSKNCGLEIVN